MVSCILRVMKKSHVYYVYALRIVILDQLLKLLVYFNMHQEQELALIGNLFKLHYTLNPGMAFGFEFGAFYGKLLLTVFRLAIIVGIGIYLHKLIQRNAHKGLIWSLILIFAGGLGNLLDSVFYGALLGIATPDAMSPWFHGQVIDMLFIDIGPIALPSWVPKFGGLTVSAPIFNIADISAFVGIIMVVVLHRRFFDAEAPSTPTTPSTTELQQQPE